MSGESTANTDRIKPRIPLFAFIMSMVLPGYGQLYNGQVNKAIWLFLGFVWLTVPMVTIAALYLPADLMVPALLLGALSVMLLWLYAVVDAFAQARRQHAYVLKPWQNSSLYVLVLMLCAGVVLPFLTYYVRGNLVESFRVPSGSMEPTVMTGDMLFADKRYNRPGFQQAVERGDIAIFIYPNDRTTYFIKRVIGLPGDHLQIRGTDIFINGKTTKAMQTPINGKSVQVTETDGHHVWQVWWAEPRKALPQTDIMIPPGYIFTMGDNRTASNDSRFFGVVPLQDVVGKARQVWFSLRGNDIRWERMGQILK